MEITIIIVLGIVCIAQIVERYFFSQRILNDLSNAQKAVMSRNINEYLSATTPPSNKDQGFRENDEVDMTELSDTEFLDIIEKQQGK